MIISKKKDAFGQFLMACYKNDKPYQLIERDDGYIDVSRFSNLYFTKYKNWSKHEKAAMKYARGKVLDIGCGAGRHALYLQNKGLNVLGIDNSPLAVKVCKLRGLKKVKIMSLNEINQFKHSIFNTIMMMGNNFGLFGSFNNAKRMLKELYKITSPDGLIIAETTNPYKTKDSYHLTYHNLNKKQGRMAGASKNQGQA